jgi:catechol 2,3-dioxygenase-like lactoylglutathione lyase family enzyme
LRLIAETVTSLGVSDGDPVAVATERGRITLPAELTPMPDGVVWLPANSPGSAVRRTRDIDARDGHLAIRVRSYDETVQHLRSHGIECLESPRNLTPWAQIYVTDPDGNVVEFNTDAPHS